MLRRCHRRNERGYVVPATKVTGRRFGFASGTVSNATPKPDFDGMHPDPLWVHAHALQEETMGHDGPDIGVASDGDGDGHPIIGRRQFITPYDLLAMLVAYLRVASGCALALDRRGRFRRNHRMLRDYEEVDSKRAAVPMTELRRRLAKLPATATATATATVDHADDFTYHDPVDGSTSERRGIWLSFKGSARTVLRLSSTDTSGSTVHLYPKQCEKPTGARDRDPIGMLGPVAAAVKALTGVVHEAGRAAPDVAM